MSFYDDMQEVAAELIGEFKQGTIRYATLTPVAGGTPDAPGVPTTSYTTVDAVARPVDTRYVDGTHVVQSDKQVTFAGGVVTPDMKDWIEIDGVKHKIVSIKNVPESGTVVAHHLIVRR